MAKDRIVRRYRPEFKRKREPADYRIRQWRLRRITKIGGSLYVALPWDLLQWVRKYEPMKWQAGDDVDVALSREGSIIIRWSSRNRLMQMESEIDEPAADVEDYAPARPRGKRKRSTTTHREGKPAKKIYVAEDDYR